MCRNLYCFIKRVRTKKCASKVILVRHLCSLCISIARVHKFVLCTYWCMMYAADLDTSEANAINKNFPWKKISTRKPRTI